MPDTDLDHAPARARAALALLAGLACAACCLLPTLIATGAVGAGASAVVGWLPVAVALAALALGGRWLAKRRAANGCACAGEAAEQDGCGSGAAELQQLPLGTRR